MCRVLLAVLFSMSPIAAFSQSVSVTNASVKIRPADGPGPDSAATISAAQNEFEAFQVVITGPATGVSVSVPTLIGPGGAAIPPGAIRLYRVEYLNITKSSNVEGATGRWPDPLIPDIDEIANEKRNAFPFDVPAGENRVVWVEVHVPTGQTAGTYQGSLSVTASLATVSVPMTLTVWNFELPSTSSLASTFGMGWNAACVAHYGSYAACGGDAGVEATHLLYARFMLDHRMTTDVVYTGPVSCSGPTCDWSHFDAVYGRLFDGTDSLSRLTGARQTSIRFIWSGTSDHYTAWARHFREKGWFDRTFDYTCDEPPNGCMWSAVGARSSVVHGADPDFRTLVTTDIDHANNNGVTGSIDILAPVVNYIHDKPGSSPYSGNQRPKYETFIHSSPRNHLWWYQSCMSHGCAGETPGDPYFSGWPSLMIDNSAVQNRAQGILSWLYGVSGILYFDTTYALSTAWTNVYAFGGNGDGTLLYPGKPSVIGGLTHIPVASLRLKMIRDGFEDYEYMKLVADLGDPAFAEQTGRQLFPTPYESRQPAASLYNAREALAQRILALKAGMPGPLSLVSAFVITPAFPAPHETTTAAFTVRNTGQQPISVQYFLAGARDPANANVDFPTSPPVTLEPGQQYTYQASRSFDTAGAYAAWPAYYDGVNWIELAPSHTSFTVTPAAPVRVDETPSEIVRGANP